MDQYQLCNSRYEAILRANCSSGKGRRDNHAVTKQQGSAPTSTSDGSLKGDCSLLGTKERNHDPYNDLWDKLYKDVNSNSGIKTSPKTPSPNEANKRRRRTSTNTTNTLIHNLQNPKKNFTNQSLPPLVNHYSNDCPIKYGNSGVHDTSCRVYSFDGKERVGTYAFKMNTTKQEIRIIVTGYQQPLLDGYVFELYHDTLVDEIVRCYAILLAYDPHKLLISLRDTILGKQLSVAQAGIEQGNVLRIKGEHPFINTNWRKRRIRIRECSQNMRATWYDVSITCNMWDIYKVWANETGMDPEHMLILREKHQMTQYGLLNDSGVVNMDELFSCSDDIITSMQQEYFEMFKYKYFMRQMQLGV